MTLFSGRPGPTTIEPLQCGDVLGSFPAQVVQRGTVTCTTECVCLRLRSITSTGGEDRRASLDGSEQLSEASDREASPGAGENSVPQLVATLWIFAHWPEEARKRLLEDLTVLHVNTGDQVVKQGGANHGELMILAQAKIATPLKLFNISCSALQFLCPTT